MRYFLFILLLSATCFPQSSNISVVSAEKLNILYRGVENPIKIAVPGAKSFTATAPGLKKVDDNGNYILSPGAGMEVKVIIEAVMEDGKTVLEEKTFKIKPVSGVNPTINGFDYGGCTREFTKEQILDIEVGYIIPDFEFIEPGKAVSFDIKITNFKNIHVEGSRLNEEAKDAVRKATIGSLVIIHELRTNLSEKCGGCTFRTYTALLRIIE